MNKALFWDFDGTLAYCDHLWSRSVYKALKDHIKDTDIVFEDVSPYLRTGFPWHTYEQEQTHLVDEVWWDFMIRRFVEIYMQLGIDEDNAKIISGTVREMIMDISKYNLYDDTIFVLERAKELGYKNYIVSNNYPELLDTMDKLDLTKYFEECISSGKIGYDKPRKEIFEYALKKAGYPDKCYMIGDNPIADIKGAKEAGIPTIFVHRDADCDADYKFSNLKDIINILD